MSAICTAIAFLHRVRALFPDEIVSENLFDFYPEGAALLRISCCGDDDRSCPLGGRHRCDFAADLAHGAAGFSRSSCGDRRLCSEGWHHNAYGANRRDLTPPYPALYPQEPLSRLQINFSISNQIRFSKELMASYLAKPYLFHLNHNTATLLRNVNQGGFYVFPVYWCRHFSY